MRRTATITIAAACLLVRGASRAGTDSQPSTAPAPAAKAPSTAPAAPTTATAPARAARNHGGPRAAVYFQFSDLKYDDLVRWFAQKAGKPILGELNVAGEFTFYDSEPYSYEDAFDTINILLAMRGFWLVEDPRYFRVVKLPQLPNESPILSGLAEMEVVRPGEVVTVVLPLKYIDPATASKAVVRKVSTWGSIAPLVKGKGLVVTDSAGNIRKIQQFIKLLDIPAIMDQQIRPVQLRRASARMVTGIINDVFGGTARRRMVYNSNTGRYEYEAPDASEVITATADDRTNTVVIMGSGEKLSMAEQVIKELDKEGEGAAEDIRIFKLRNLKAEETAKTLREILSGGVPRAIPAPPGGNASGRYGRYRSSPGGASAATAAPDRIRIVADAAGNRLIVSAPVDEMPGIEKLIKELDGDAVGTGTARIFRLKAADAGALADIVSHAVTAPDARGQARPTLQVSADTRTNSLVVTGPGGDIQMAATLIEELDKPTAVDTREIHVVQLQAGDARQIASSMVKLFAKEVGGSRGRGTTVSSLRCEADVATNSLLIAASPGDWPVVQKILDQLKASVAPLATASTCRYVLKAAKADEIAETLRQIYGGARAGRGSAPSRGPSPAAVPVVIAAHKDTNTLLVSAALDDQKAIAELITALDVPSAEKVDPIRLVRLTSAEAPRLAATLRAMQPPPARGQTSDVLIEAEPLTNSLLIRAPEAKWKMLEEMIARLDADKTRIRETRIILLRHTSATALAGMLGDLYAGAGAAPSSRGRSRGQQPAGGEERVVITPAPGDRALVVDAPKARIDEIAALVEQLDSKESPGTVQTRTYDLAAANAVDVAASLERLFAQQRSAGGGRGQPGGNEPQPRFEANAASNQLLVAATAAQFVEIDKLINSVQAGTKAASETRTFRLKFVKAVDIVDVLATMLAEEAPAPSSRSRRGSPNRPAGKSAGSIRVAAVLEANAVVVQGPPAKLALAEKLIAGFDTPDVAATTGIEVVRLKRASAAVLVGTLRNMMPPPPKGEPQQVYLEPELPTNSILLRAPEAERQKLLAIIASLDANTADQSRKVRIVPVKHASANALAMMLDQLYGGAAPATRSPSSRGRSGSRSPAAAAPDESVIITAAPGDKALVIDAPTARIDEIAKLVASLDVADSPATVQVRTYQLANANAVEVAQSLARLFAGQAPPAGAGSRGRTPMPAPGAPGEIQPRFEADTTTNQLMVAATAAQFEQIEKVIKDLQAATTLAVQTKSFPLKFAQASEIAGVLETMLLETAPSPSRSRSPGTRAPGTQAGTVRVAAVNGANAVVVQGPPEKLALAEKLVAAFDTPQAAGTAVIRLVPLKNAQAEALAARLSAMVPPPERGKTQEVFIQADPLTNSVLLRAPEGERKMLEEMIARLDEATRSQARETRILPLKCTSASALAATLEEVYVAPGAAAARPQSGRTRTLSPAGADEAQRVVITAAPGDRALVVDAPRATVEQIAGMVARLDVEDAAGKGSVRTFTLKHARAADVADVLAVMLSETQTPYTRAPSRTRGPAGGAAGKEAPDVRVAAMEGTNTVVVQAPPDRLLLAEGLIRTFDVPEAGGKTVIEVVKLSNAQAASLADAVSTALAARAARAGPPRPGAAGDQAVTVTAEINSNSVLIRGPARDVPEVVEMIRRLDTQGTSSAVQVRVFKLENSSAVELEKPLAKLFKDIVQQGAQRTRGGTPVAPPPFSVVADERTNNLVVSTTAANFAIVESLLASLDKAGPLRDVQYAFLERASAAEVAEKLNAMYADRRGDAKPVIEADEISNAVSIVAKEADLKAMEAVIAKLEKAAEWDDRPIVRVIPLQRIRASQMADVIQRVYGQMTDVPIHVTEKLPGRPGAEEDPNAGTLLPAIFPVDGPPLLSPRDSGRGGRGGGRGAAAPAPEPGPKPISRALPREGDAPTTAPATRPAGISISVDRTSNSLIVLARRDELSNIQAIIDQLAANAQQADAELRVFRIRKADPTSIANTLDSLFNPKPQAGAAGAGGGRRGGGEPAVLPEPKINVVPDARTKSLIVRAKPAEFELIIPLIAQLDTVATVISEVRIFTLRNTDAAEVADNLKELFRLASQQPPMPQPGQPQQQRGRSAQQARAELIRQMIEMRGAGGTTQVDPATAISISANRNTNSVIVSAPADAMKLVEKIIEELDQATAMVQAVRLYPLKHAEVRTTVTALREIFSTGGASPVASTGGFRGSRGGTSRGPSGVGREAPVLVTGDEASRLLIVSAPAEKHELIEKVINEIDTAQAVGEVTVKVYRVEHADATTLAAALGEALSASAGGARSAGGRSRGGAPGADAGGAGQLRIAADRGSNCLVVRAAKEDHERIGKLIAEMDAAPADKYPVRTIALKNADAEEMAALLSRMFAAGGAAGQARSVSRGRGGRGGSFTTGGGAAVPTGVAIDADRNARTLLVRADDETFKKIQQLVTTLDVPGSSATLREIIALKHVKAGDLAAALSATFAPARQQRTAVGEVATIVPEPMSNSLIVTASATDMERIKALVAALDTETGGGGKTEFLVLKNAQAADMAGVLMQISGTRGGAATGGGGAYRGGGRQRVPTVAAEGVVVSAEPSSNAVVLSGPVSEVDKLLEIARKLDNAAAATAAAVVKLYPLKNAEVAPTVEALQQIFGASGPSGARGYRSSRGTSRGPGEQVPVTIIGDEGAHKVLVSAPEDKHALIAKVIEDIDTSQQAENVTVRVYRLENAQAQAAASALAQAMTGAAAAGRSRTGAGAGAGAAGQLRIAADASSNSIVVRAGKDDHERIAKLLAEMDAPTAERYPVRTVALKNAEADAVADTLNRLFAGAAGTAAGARGRGGAQGPKGGVVIEPDRGARMLLVRADEATFKKITDVVALLDVPGTGKAVPTIIAMKHAQAAAIAPALQAAFSPQRGQRTKPEEMITVVAEPMSNSLLVTADGTNLEKVKALVAQLDAPDVGGMKTELLVLKNARSPDLAAVLAQVAGSSSRGARGRGGAPAAPGQELIVTGEAASNAVVFSGPAADVERLVAMARKLDDAAGASAVPVVKLYPLKNAEVATTVAALQEIFGAAGAGGTSRAPRGTARAQETPVTIIGDEAARKVIVSASEDKHALIAKVIGEIDQAQTEGQVLVKVYRLTNAQAQAAATALNQTLSGAPGAAGRGGRGATAGGAGQLRISADPSSNSIVVRASKDDHDRIAALLAEMDVPAAGKYPVQTIALTNADATEAAAVLNRVFNPAAGAAGRGGAQGAKGAAIIEADRSSRMLLVRADEETFAKIKEMATKLDTNPAGRAARTLLALKHAKAEAVAAALTAAFTPPRGQRIDPEELVNVVPDPATNSILVTANAPNLEKVKGLLTQLDTDVAGERTELLLLKNAKATDLAKTLTGIAAAAKGAAGGRGGAAAPAAKGATISADAASNGLVVTGPRDEVEKLMQMAVQLDRAAESSISSVEVLALKNGDAAVVAGMIRDLYAQQVAAAKANQQAIGPLAVTADDRANALVVAASKDMHETVSRWVAQIEQMKPSRGTLRLIQLRNVDPAEVERAIQQLYNAPSGGARGPTGATAPPARRPGAPARAGTAAAGGSGRVQTSVLDAQRSILINASDEDFETIKALAKALDEAAAATRQVVQVFVLRKADNKRVATALTSMYRPVAGRTVRPEDQVVITALDQTNAVVASAGKEKLAEVAHLIEQLDKEEVAPPLQFRIYPLTNAQPTKIMPALQQMLTQIRKLRPDETIDVQADERTRSIIVTAKATLFDEIGKVIEALDKPPAHAKVEVLVIALKKADAARLAEVLTAMLRPSATGQVTPEAQALQQHVRLLRVRGAAEDIPDLDMTQPIKIIADPTVSRQQGSNALIVTSTPENLKAMQAIVDILDTVPLADDVRVKVLHLKNADAASVTTILKDIFTQGKQLAGQPKSTVAGMAEPKTVTGRALVNVLNVSADLRTNTLVLSGIEEALALAELIVADLDRQEGKIVTQVRLFKLKSADAAKLLPLLQAVFAEGAPVPGSEGLQTQVTRLQTVLKDKQGRQTAVPKVRAALTIQADGSTNILIVAARSDVMPLIADVIEGMDIPGAGSLASVRFCPLDYADATAVRDIINALHAGPNAALIRAEDKPTVAVDTRTNAVIVSASPRTWEVLEPLLKRLDAKKPPGADDVRIIPLKSADATTLGTALQRIMDSRVQRYTTQGAVIIETLRMTIIPDTRSNSLIVGGNKDGFDLVKALAEQLDGASPALGGQIQLLALKEANAGSMATTLTSFFTQRYAAVTPELAKQKPVILPDLRTNSLLVAANADDSAVLKTLLARLDVKLTDPAVQLVVVPLLHNTAGVVGPMLQQIFAARLTSMTPPGQTPAPQDKVDVTSDALANALVISASKENLALIRSLLEKVDVEPPAETGVVRLFFLKNSDAQRVATMLQTLVSQGLYKPGLAAVATNPALAAREKVSIVVDTRTNVLIVSASKENFAVLAEIIAKIDASADFTVLGDLRIYPLKRANAVELSATLQKLFDAKRAAEVAAGGTGRSLAVSVIPDPRTNTLLVAGSRESFAAMDVMVAKLDGDQIVAATVFRVFPLKNGTAAMLQPTLDKLFQQRATRGATKEAVTIIADPHANSLIVGASPADMEVAATLIEQLDKAKSAPGTAVQAFPLQKADATQVAKTLQELYRAAGAGAAGAPEVNISVDERTNTIMVSAGPADAKRIAELIAQLDRVELTSVTEIRVFPLQNADATELGRILTDTLTNKPKAPTTVSPNRQTLLQFVSQTADGRELIERALQEGVLITPDARTNSLIVAAPIKSMPLLESLVRAMDSTSPRQAEIRIFAMVNADARQMGDVLTALFRLRGGAATTTSTGGAAGTSDRAFQYTLVTTQPAQPPGPSATIGTAEQEALSVTIDVRTNSLLVCGTKRYVTLAAKVIETLDSCPAQERLTKVYRLRNAQATNIQTAMRSFLDQEKQRLTSTLGQQAVGSAFQILEREVAVVAEPNSNTLLLSASPRYFETVEAMIRELDQPPPQVLIQVLLAEVKLDETNELGIDWNLTHKWNKGKDSVGYGTNFGVSAQASGFSLAVTAGDLEMFLRALQSQGKLEVLSRPQILASDNQKANINVGQSVPFVTNTTINIQSGGGIFNTIQYQDVGIILNVTPRINPDGFVKLQVNPEISSLSSSTVDISEGVKAVIINKRSAATTVTVQDGHTIVIGGLITTTDDNSESKVPLIGDWPILGPLFRATTRKKERTELLIILTPHVLRGVEAADKVTNEQRDRINMLRKLQREQIEGSLRKYLDKFLSEQNGGLAHLRPTTQPASAPASRAAAEEMGSTPAVVIPPIKPAQAAPFLESKDAPKN